MKISKFVISGLAASGMLLSSPLLMAQDDVGLYVGGAYGIANVDDSEFDDENGVPQGFLGLQLNSILGIEASYMDFGSYGNDVIRSDTDGFGLALTGTLPLTESFSLFAKAGQFWWDTDVSALGFEGNYDGRELMYGVGLGFAMTERLDFRLTYDRLDIELDEDEIGPIASGDFDSEVDIVSAGLRFMF